MLHQPAFPTPLLRRYLLAAPLVLALALGHSAAHAQAVPKPAPAAKSTLNDATIYVDGKLLSQADLNSIDPNTISNIEVLKEEAQRKVFGNTAGKAGTVVVTTKANANSPEVLALNQRIRSAVPLVPATPEQNAAIAAAQAYITKNYPNAKLESVGPVPGNPNRYSAIFLNDNKRVSLQFDGNGQVVE